MNEAEQTRWLQVFHLGQHSPESVATQLVKAERELMKAHHLNGLLVKQCETIRAEATQMECARITAALQQLVDQ